MHTITITRADGLRIGADISSFPWNHPDMESGIDLEIVTGSAVNGGGLMLRCPALGIFIGGDTARALLGDGHPAIAASRHETQLVLDARSRHSRALSRRRMIDHDRGRGRR